VSILLLLLLLCLQEKKLEIYNAIVKLQKGDESDEKFQVCFFFVHPISFIASCFTSVF
jgi:hypothetical protein